MEENNGAKFIYLLMGVGIGATLGILFAPQAGEKTREMILGKAEEGRDYLTRTGRDFRDQTTDYIERGKSALNKQKDNLAAAIEAGKQAYRSESAKGMGVAE